MINNYVYFNLYNYILHLFLHFEQYELLTVFIDRPYSILSCISVKAKTKFKALLLQSNSSRDFILPLILFDSTQSLHF